jgi:hypothetical protein
MFHVRRHNPVYGLRSGDWSCVSCLITQREGKGKEMKEEWREYAPVILDAKTGKSSVNENYRYIVSGGQYMADDGTGFCMAGYITPSNARLMAAAPELLEACKAVLEEDDGQRSAFLVRDAIAKAEGK